MTIEADLLKYWEDRYEEHIRESRVPHDNPVTKAYMGLAMFSRIKKLRENVIENPDCTYRELRSATHYFRIWHYYRTQHWF